MSIKIRINQVEFRNNCNTNPSIDKGEFLIWSPNDRYGKIEDYLQIGYTKEGLNLRSPSGSYISLSLFESKELCIVIAWLKYDKKEGCCTLESVGPRLLEMNNEEKKDFFEVYEIAEKKMNEANEWELID
jgi:hypothetical protein